VPGLGTSFGRGGATTFQQDLQHADCILIEGSSMAEAHPIAFRWVMKAKERGAKVIHVDPRYSRTSQLADRHVPIRAGTDIAFLGGVIRHVLETESYFRDYVVNYTNAPTIIDERFQDVEDLGGVFSGFDPETGMYDHTTWMYEGGEVAAAAGAREHSTQTFSMKTGAGMLVDGVKRDDTLQHPRCVFQILRRHFGRYTPEMVERVCGISRDDFQAVADALVENSGRERTSAICYAVGWAHHSVGVQIIRTAAVLQLLLGNVGRRGAESSRCAVTPRSRARRTSRRSMTCSRGTSACRTLTSVSSTWSATSRRTVPSVDGGRFSAVTSCRSSRPGLATPLLRRTTTASRRSRRSAATTPTSPR
jgi:formate dehydrogenase major subunit